MKPSLPCDTPRVRAVPLRTAEFVTGLERVLGRRIARRTPGPAQAVQH